MCCGSQRAAARQAALGRAASATTMGVSAGLPAADATSTIMFEYIGSATPAIVRGPVSGRTYRFAHPGDRRQVDARDRPGLAQWPLLRWVR